MMDPDTVPYTTSLACRALAASCLACVYCGTATGMSVGGAGAAGCKSKGSGAANAACQAVAAACLAYMACVACGMAAGAGTGRAGAAGSRRRKEGPGCGQQPVQFIGLRNS